MKKPLIIHKYLNNPWLIHKPKRVTRLRRFFSRRLWLPLGLATLWCFQRARAQRRQRGVDGNRGQRVGGLLEEPAPCCVRNGGSWWVPEHVGFYLGKMRISWGQGFLMGIYELLGGNIGI